LRRHGAELAVSAKETLDPALIAKALAELGERSAALKRKLHEHDLIVILVALIAYTSR